MPAQLRLADPTAPLGYRTVRPTPGQSAIVPTNAGPVMLTPQKILKSYIDTKKRLPDVARKMRQNQRRLQRTGARLNRLRRFYRRHARRSPGTSGPLRSRFRNVERKYNLALETHNEMAQAMTEAATKLDQEEKRASIEEGLGFLVLAWPLAVIISSLALGAFGISKEMQETKRLEEELDAIEKGTLPQGGMAAAAGGIGGQIVKAAAPLLLGAGALWFVTRRRRAA